MNQINFIIIFFTIGFQTFCHVLTNGSFKKKDLKFIKRLIISDYLTNIINKDNNDRYYRCHRFHIRSDVQRLGNYMRFESDLLVDEKPTFKPIEKLNYNKNIIKYHEYPDSYFKSIDSSFDSEDENDMVYIPMKSPIHSNITNNDNVITNSNQTIIDDIKHNPQVISTTLPFNNNDQQNNEPVNPEILTDTGIRGVPIKNVNQIFLPVWMIINIMSLIKINFIQFGNFIIHKNCVLLKNKCGNAYGDWIDFKKLSVNSDYVDCWFEYHDGHPALRYDRLGFRDWDRYQDVRLFKFDERFDSDIIR